MNIINQKNKIIENYKRPFLLYFLCIIIPLTLRFLAANLSHVKSYLNTLNKIKNQFAFICLLIPMFLLMSCTMNKMLKKEINYLSLQNNKLNDSVLCKNEIDNLPYPIQKWIKQSGLNVNKSVDNAWLTQKVKIKMKPEQQNWYYATAEQRFTINNPGFIWTVNMRMSPFVKIKGRDKLVDGKGEMLIRMNSLFTIVNEKGPKIDEASMQRFLGEIVWFPSAALCPYIKWEAIDSLSAKATIYNKKKKTSGIFYFNEYGDFVKYSALRYIDNTPASKQYQWVIEVSEYGIFNGVTIPIKMTATWELDEGDWTWLEIELMDIKYNII